MHIYFNKGFSILWLGSKNETSSWHIIKDLESGKLITESREQRPLVAEWYTENFPPRTTDNQKYKGGYSVNYAKVNVRDAKANGT